MNKFTSLSMATALVVAMSAFATTPAMASETAGAAAQMPGQKVDSGLGDLPHYSQWADPTGRNPLRRNTAASGAQDQVAGEKKDSGLGALPHYSLWTDKAGRLGTQLSQAR